MLLLPDEILPLHRDQAITRMSYRPNSTSPNDNANDDNEQPEINNIIDCLIVNEDNDELPPPPKIPIGLSANVDVQITESEINNGNAIHVVDETITPLNN